MEYTLNGNYVQRNGEDVCHVHDLVTSFPYVAGEMIREMYEEISVKKGIPPKPTFASTLLAVVTKLREDYPHNKEAARIEAAITEFIIMNRI